MSAHHHRLVRSKAWSHHQVIIISSWQAGMSAIIMSSSAAGKQVCPPSSASSSLQGPSSSHLSCSCQQKMLRHPGPITASMQAAGTLTTQVQALYMSSGATGPKNDWIGTAAAYGLTWAAMSDAMMFGSARTSEPGGFHQDCTALVKPSPC